MAFGSRYSLKPRRLPDTSRSAANRLGGLVPLQNSIVSLKPQAPVAARRVVTLPLGPNPV